jgi:hypothetical protein
MKRAECSIRIKQIILLRVGVDVWCGGFGSMAMAAAASYFLAPNLSGYNEKPLLVLK